MATPPQPTPSTRGRIIDLLRRGRRTVEELAAKLGITDNGIRSHLTALERDGVVRSIGVRREGSVGKPATVYEIDPVAEPSFSGAYVPLLSTLLDTLGDRMDERELRALMREVGKRLGAGSENQSGSLKTRAEVASGVLNQLGGITTVESGEAGTVMIRGCGCPLSAAVSARPEVCVAVQTMVSEIVGAPVRECCDRTDRANCCFEIRRSA